MAKILNANLDTNLGGENASNEVISSQKAVKTYVDDRSLGIVSDTDGNVVIGSNLGGIPSGGGSITVDTTLSTTSTNPVQNKVVTVALNSKLDSTVYVVDTTLDTTSTNPVQNSAVATALNGKQDISNLVTTVSANSTDAQYPSAKCIYTLLGSVETRLSQV